jgi:small nuclear ribonucleoprotein (snRNP)-like protein
MKNKLESAIEGLIEALLEEKSGIQSIVDSMSVLGNFIVNKIGRSLLVTIDSGKLLIVTKGEDETFDKIMNLSSEAAIEITKRENADKHTSSIGFSINNDENMSIIVIQGDKTSQISEKILQSISEEFGMEETNCEKMN